MAFAYRPAKWSLSTSARCFSCRDEGNFNLFTLEEPVVMEVPTMDGPELNDGLGHFLLLSVSANTKRTGQNRRRGGGRVRDIGGIHAVQIAAWLATPEDALSLAENRLPAYHAPP